MLEDESRKKTIMDALAVLEVAVRNRSAVGLLDIHKVAEDFCAGFLNRLEPGLSLTNLNVEHKNNSAIDLGDETAGVSYQVTSVTAKAKVQETLDQFVKHGWHKKYKRLQVLMLAEPKAKAAYKGLAVDSTKVSFSPDVDIIGLKKLGELAIGKSVNLVALAEFVAQQMPLLTAFLADSKVNDMDALRVYGESFNRDALRHPIHMEGPMQNFEKALTDLVTLIEKGEIDGKRVAKSRNEFEDGGIRSGLEQVSRALGALRGLFNQHVNTGEIDPKGRGCTFHDHRTADRFNDRKQAVVNSLNLVLRRQGLPAIRGVGEF